MNASMAGLCIAGGVIAYKRSRSVPSLVGGIALGTMYGISTYNIYQYHMVPGHLIGALTSGLTLAIMGRRFMTTGKFMPAGLLTLSSGAVGAYNWKKYADWSD